MGFYVTKLEKKIQYTVKVEENNYICNVNIETQGFL